MTNRMKSVCAVFLLLLLLTARAEGARSAFSPPPARTLQSEDRQTGTDVRSIRTSAEDEKAKLIEELGRLKEQVGAEEKALEDLQKQFEDRERAEKESRAELNTDDQEIQALEETIRAMVVEAEALVRGSAIAAAATASHHDLQLMIGPDYSPDVDGVQRLTDVLFELMDVSGRVRKRAGGFVDSGGKEVFGEILHIGPFTALYRIGEEVGYLRPDRRGERLVAVSGSLRWFMRKTIRSFFDGEAPGLPVDLSGGAALERLSQHRDLMEWLRSGGILVWPILMIGLAALALVLERTLFLGRVKADSGRFMEELQTLADEGRWEECREHCRRHSRMPVCEIAKTALSTVGASREVIENAVQEAILRELPRLERFLPTLSVLAAVAPLVGLLGTVTGMIETFQVITLFGTGDPRLMSGGISVALITTQLGLAVAIPIMIIHNFLERRVDRIIAEMEEKGVALSVILLKNKETSCGDLASHAA